MSDGERPTLRTLAEIAGVSAMTMSRALRGSRGVSPALKEKLVTLAESHGYRPDPEIRKLMQYLRKNRSSRLQGGICALISERWQRTEPEAYCRKVLDGARLRATDLGFVWHTIVMEDLLRQPRRISRKLVMRGIDGILVPPLFNACDIPSEMRWDDFSGVAATHSVTSPILHRVVPNHFYNISVICDHLYARGYRRLGLFATHDDEIRSRFHFTSAVAGFCFRQGLHFVPPLLVEHFFKLGNELNVWMEKERPDALILNGDFAANMVRDSLKLEIPGEVAIASADCQTDEWAGIVQLPEQIGTMAVDLLSGMVMHNEKGVPDHPTVLMVEGRWQDGALGSAPLVDRPSGGKP